MFGDEELGEMDFEENFGIDKMFARADRSALGRADDGGIMGVDDLDVFGPGGESDEDGRDSWPETRWRQEEIEKEWGTVWITCKEPIEEFVSFPSLFFHLLLSH